MSALFDLPTPVVEPSPCIGEHEHRWLWFGAKGERDEVLFTVDPDGAVTLTEADLEQLLRRAGYKPHDPDPIEIAATRRRDWARSRLQDGLNAALNRRAR